MPLRFFAALLILCCSLVPAWAQPATPTPSPTPKSPILMELTSPVAATEKPLSIACRFGKWFPVGINLKNTGDPVKGEVRMRLLMEGGGGFEYAPNEYATEVDLPPTSNKVVWLYGRFERQEANAIEVTFSGRGFSPLTERVRLEAIDPARRLVLSITDGDERISYLSGLRGPGYANFEGQNGISPNSNQAPVRPISTTKSNVPDRWIGFDIVDLLVLGDFAHTELSPDQISAIRDFAHGGGNLLVPSGARWQRLTQSPLADLWPVDLKSSTSASAGEVQGLVRHYYPNPTNGADRLGGAPVVVSRGGLKSNAVLRDGSASAPLFVVNETGAGRCMFLTYDPTQPPFIGWRGLDSLWKEIFAQSVKPRRFDSVDPGAAFSLSNGNFNNNWGGGGGFNPYQTETPSSPTANLFQALQKAPQLKMPPVSQIAWFLALYVFFLVPVNYAVLRFFDRRELAWITIPGIVVAFSLLAYQTALTLRGRAILTRQVDIVQSSVGATGGRTDSLLWLFSPRKTAYDVSATAKNAVVSDYLMEGRDPASITIGQPKDTSFVAERAGVLMWADRPFTGQAVVDLDKGVQFFPGATPRLQNNTAYDLRSAVLVQDGKVQPFGDVKVGATAAARTGDGLNDVAPEITGRILGASNLNAVFDPTTLTNNIPSLTLAAALGPNWGKYNKAGLIVAWSEKPTSQLTFSGHPGGRDVTLFVFRIPATSQNRVASTEALVEPSYFKPVSDPGRYYGADGGGQAIFNVTLPSDGKWLLKARGRGLGTPKEYSGYAGDPLVRNTQQGNITFLAQSSASKQWTPVSGRLRRDNSPEGGWNFEGQLPGQLVKNENGQVTVLVQLGSGVAKVNSLRVVQERVG